MQAPEPVKMGCEQEEENLFCQPVRYACPMDVNVDSEFPALKPLSMPKQATMNDQEDICNLMDLRCNMTEGCHFMGDSEVLKRDATDTPVEELIPISAFCCNIYSLFCGFPSCLGCNGQGMVLFCLCKWACCKCLDCKDEDKKCCAICNCNCYSAAPTKLWESTCQCFFIDSRCAFPCTNKVPCMLNYFGFTICADFKIKFGCCKKIGDLIPRIKERAGEATQA